MHRGSVNVNEVPPGDRIRHEKNGYRDLRAKFLPCSWKGCFLEDAQENAWAVTLTVLLHNAAQQRGTGFPLPWILFQPYPWRRSDQNCQPFGQTPESCTVTCLTAGCVEVSRVHPTDVVGRSGPPRGEPAKKIPLQCNTSFSLSVGNHGMDKGSGRSGVVQNKVSWPLGIQTLTLAQLCTSWRRATVATTSSSLSSPDPAGHAEVGHGKSGFCVGPVERGQRVPCFGVTLSCSTKGTESTSIALNMY